MELLVKDSMLYHISVQFVIPQTESNKSIMLFGRMRTLVAMTDHCTSLWHHLHRLWCWSGCSMGRGHFWVHKLLNLAHLHKGLDFMMHPAA